jgi:uncharacterized membrane protein
METYIVDWLNLGVRWLHFIAGIAWIGSSLYFVMLDNSLKAPKKDTDRQRGVHGELWAVHGGGFYHSQKLLTGPKGEPLSQDLHWSKWEAYTTWLSGMGLLALIYWWGANSYLIDRSVLDISAPAAIAISAASLVVGWFVYDTLCKTIKNELALALIVFVLLVAAAYGYAHVFGARAAYIHTGALMGTIMVWNVFFHIIPGQKKIVEEIRAGKEPDPRPGIIGKQRSVHNTYFTLPVLFIMISNHYPMTYGNKYGWLILAVFILAGALIRQFFVLRHQGKVIWALPVVGALLLLGTAIVLAPASKSGGAAAAEAVSFASVQPIFQQRCVTCHAEKPTFEGFQQPPAGVMLDTPERIHAAAPRIHQQTIATQTMPLGNLTKMTPEERALLGKWLAEGASIK